MATYAYKANPNGHCRLCTDKDKKEDMVACDECDRWFHISCVGLTYLPKKDERWVCPKCMSTEREMMELKVKVRQSVSGDSLQEILQENRAAMEALVKSMRTTRFEAEPGTSSAHNNDSIEGQNQEAEPEWTVYLKRQALMSLPKYGGAAREWPKFKKAFDETTKQGQFNRLENLNRLQTVLYGNAERSVRQLMMDPNNMDQIIDRLEDNFGRPELVYKELLAELTNIKRESRNLITEISEALDNLVCNVSLMDREEFLIDHRLVEEIIRKMPYGLQVKWTEEMYDGAKTLADLNEWLKPHSRTNRLLNGTSRPQPRETSRPQPREINRSQPRDTRPERRFNVNTHQENRSTIIKRNCEACRGNHKLLECTRFKAMKPEKRNELAFKAKVCLSCLAFTNHMMRDCKRAKQCGINGCKFKHHPLIHKSHERESSDSNQSEGQHSPDTQADGEIHNHQQLTKSNVFYQIVPVTLKNNDKIINTFAFLDAGSSLSLIDEEIANKLGLNGRIDPLMLKWTQNVTRNEQNSRRVQVRINGNNEKEYVMKGVRTIKNLQLPEQSFNKEVMEKRYPYLKNLPLSSYSSIRPTILIGLSHSHLLIPFERRMRKPNEPTALRTKLGWFMFGNISSNVQGGHIMVIQQEDEMNKALQKYFSTEDFGVKVVKNLPKSAEEEKAEQILRSTMKYKDGRYEVGLLWKDEETKFPNSYNNAAKRLTTSERTLKKDPELKKWAIETFADYEKKGYIRKLSEEEIMKPISRVYYLPHFIVHNKNKLPPKPRLVFDAAAKTQGVSFNTELLSGPDATTSLFGVLVRFREGAIAVCGDIKEMFHQVRIRAEDQHAQRFLWRDCDSSKKPDVYVMQVMTFGSTCSPSCAQAVKNHNAEKFRKYCPVATEAIIKQHYVDDYLDSFEELDKAAEIVLHVMKIHDHAGFHIRNFVSNSRELLQSLPSERVQISGIKMFEEKDSMTEKVLGVYWNTTSDTLGYQIKLDKLGSDVTQMLRLPTKREVLAFVMSVYDPLGLISNITVHGRILMQRLHIENIDWDDEIPEKLQSDWQHWLEIIESADSVTIPRYILEERTGEVELHTFVDASEKAFCACVYVRSISGNTPHVRLLSAKSRVAPVKPLSIPRLELQAAVLGSRLTKTIIDETRLKIVSKTFWSDSQTVLSWIKSPKRRSVFVMHRVGEILEDNRKNEWRWVPTDENPADEGTKEKLGKSQWFEGPDFLKLSESSWPSIEEKETDEELRETVLVHEELSKLSFIDKYKEYSDWWKLVKNLCVLNRTKERLRRGYIPDIEYKDYQRAENVLYRKMQWEAFPTEMETLFNGGTISSGPLVSYAPFLDEAGVMRSGGRLKKAMSVPWTTRTPILLPQKHPYTYLIVKATHERYFHHGENTVIAALRQKYWILHIRTVLANVKKNCNRCKIRHATPVEPMMADLPHFRTEAHIPPFTNCGVDYFGPFEVAVKRSLEKRWGVIFTCLSTRAVHIEMAENLSTDAFMVVLRNFQNRRGKVTSIYSDNGTNFVGAERELKSLVNEINEKMGKNEAAKMEIQWRFNPPSAPHFGGAWERLIRNVKVALAEILKVWGRSKPSAATLQAAFIQAEFLVNSRPLTHIPVSCIDDEVLTPFHALIGRAGEYAPPYAPTTSQYDTAQWRRIQHYSKLFWNRWKKEYLPTLLKRNKNTQKVEPIKVNDIVLITDDDAPPGKWLKGRVIETFVASDGQVRQAKIQTAKGVLKRPAVKIAVLDIIKGNDPAIN
ncbi:uncharacterized protein LOC129766371 [Toxorhynchites rutilus septentrionalis]|uniref:uncharacterized protein LOC129766371 n=1 Tax=Toxorhynchites rutilus septentrionalis TaxID=329112 RepID=UPI00247A815B|nr:uncharacterized protein LOC129766371 [Toxorhynchites rutilus septentrionalis]